jgi:hypothetical protein
MVPLYFVVPTTAEQSKLNHAVSNEVQHMTETALTFTDLLKLGHKAINWHGEGCKNKQGTPANVNEMLKSTVHHK